MADHPRSITDHLSRVLALAPTPLTRTVPVTTAGGQVLAADAVAALAVPPFSNSAMDGYLVHSGDLSPDHAVTLPVAGDVPAGGVARPPRSGEAVRIMTGAPVGDPVPPGLQVIPVELTDVPAGPGELPTTVTVPAEVPDRAHIRCRGENIAPGEVAVPSGTRIDPGTLAALVSVGITEVPVHPAPRVAVLSSGDELVPAGQLPGPGQLPDSNQPLLTGLLSRAGVTGIICFHTGDSPRQFRAGLHAAAEQADLVITTGGVSAGAFDVVREVAGAEGVWFGPVAMQPGKPQGLGTWEGTPLVCLPGNPVAVFVSFHLFVAPLLQALGGGRPGTGLLDRPHVWARPAAAFPTPKKRPLLVPVRLDWSGGAPTAAPFTPSGVGSHLVVSLSGVDGLAVLDPADPESSGGPPLPVLLIR